MKNYEHKNRIRGVLWVSAILIVLALGVFIINFSKQEISSDINDWGSFGGYVSGIISLISLGLLAYLTYILADNDIQENKSLQFKIKKNEAYIDLTQNNQSITRFIQSTAWIIPRIIKFAREESNELTQVQFIKVIDIFTSEYNDAKSLLNRLTSFRVQYGHLFDYDFNSEEYNQLVALSNKNISWMNDLMESIHSFGYTQDQDIKQIEKLGKLMTEEDFIQDLKKLSKKIANLLNGLRDEL